MSLKVLDPGPLTTVQDAGRTGYAAKGYRVCGAADRYAYRLGNMLIGNAPGAAVLECTLRGAALRPPGKGHPHGFPRLSIDFSIALPRWTVYPCRTTHRCLPKRAVRCKWAWHPPACAVILPWAAA